jgi:signal recognition particle GTPase
VRVKAVGDEVLHSLTPDQHVVRIVRDEMLGLFGTAPGGLSVTQRTPRVVLMLGLQGSGKTTSSAKLALADLAGPSPISFRQKRGGRRRSSNCQCSPSRSA